MKRVVITGVSTRIGPACVKMLLSRDFRVFGSIRNQTDADRLQRDFGERSVPKRFINWTIPQLIAMRILDKLVAQFFGIKKRSQE